MSSTRNELVLDVPTVTREDSFPPAVEETAGHEPAGTGPDDAALPAFAPPSFPACPPERLGKYRIVREVGRGGMGVIYLAVDDHLGREVALKVMQSEAAKNPSAKARFLREAQAAARITSDHVVSIFETGEIDGTAYTAFQYLRGCPLDEHLLRNGLPPFRDVIRIARETAVGLSDAHALGFVHRDIKPGNLWLEAPAGRVKILDFGLVTSAVAADRGELTDSGAAIGTPTYMAPEQGLGQPVDERADLFSLGCVLYRLCTGRLPFDGPTLMAVHTALATETPTPVEDLNPAVPPPLADLIRRLLAKKAADRPPTALAVAAELGAMAEPDSATDHPPAVGPSARIPAPDTRADRSRSDTAPTVAATPPRTAEHPRPRGSRRPIAALLVGAAICAAVVVGFTFEFATADGAGPDGAGPVAPEPPVHPTPPVAVAPPAATDRTAAGWVLSAGGQATVSTHPVRLTAVADVPELPFQLTGFVLNGTRAVTDDALTVFAGCRHLARVHLSGVRVSDAGAAHFRGCPLVTDLFLADTGIGDAGLACFKGCERLNYLVLANTKVTDAGLAHAAGWPKLACLNLDHTAVTDAGLARLGHLAGLTHVSLTGTPITAAGLDHFRTSGGTLTALCLRNCAGVTDAAVLGLARLDALTDVDVTGTAVSPEGVAALRKALPQCRLVSDYGTYEPK